MRKARQQPEESKLKTSTQKRSRDTTECFLVDYKLKFEGKLPATIRIKMTKKMTPISRSKLRTYSENENWKGNTVGMYVVEVERILVRLGSEVIFRCSEISDLNGTVGTRK